MERIQVANNTRKPTPKLPYKEVKAAILGRQYECSLVFIGNTLSRRLNRTYRGKDKATNVLSFPLSPKSGEIFINLSHLGSFSVAELLIHGLLHLKGMRHGDTMEQAEKKFLKKFTNGKTPNRRHRHRQLQGEDGHRRRS